MPYSKIKTPLSTGFLINGVFLANNGSINISHDKASRMRVFKHNKPIANGLHSYKKQIDLINGKIY